MAWKMEWVAESRQAGGNQEDPGGSENNRGESRPWKRS